MPLFAENLVKLLAAKPAKKLLVASGAAGG